MYLMNSIKNLSSLEVAQKIFDEISTINLINFFKKTFIAKQSTSSLSSVHVISAMIYTYLYHFILLNDGRC